MALPNWPKLLSPQHLTPLLVAAQVCHVPSATSLTPLVSPLTSIGMCDVGRRAVAQLAVLSLHPST